jgi:hypothetical protein
MVSPNHRLTAHLLDWQRCGKQRVEGAQLIMLALRKLGLLETNNTRGWANHPALRYWHNPNQSYVPALYKYVQEMRFEWIRRGYKDIKMGPLMDKLGDIIVSNRSAFIWDTPRFSDAIYISHRSKLLQKNYEYYEPIFKRFQLWVPADWKTIEYVWEQPF